jgi:hypothetical protein
MAGADLLWEKSTAGWLLAAGLFWEKSTVGWWLISRTNRLLDNQNTSNKIFSVHLLLHLITLYVILNELNTCLFGENSHCTESAHQNLTCQLQV